MRCTARACPAGEGAANGDLVAANLDAGLEFFAAGVWKYAPGSGLGGVCRVKDIAITGRPGRRR